MVLLLYEVLLHAERPSAFGQKGRWYRASAHQDIAGAEAAYRALTAQFLSPAVTVAVIRSEHDPASGLFVDRIVRATGRLPMIDRQGMERLDTSARATLEKQFAPAPSMLLQEEPLSLASARPMPWAWVGFVAATVGLFAAITVG